MATLNPMEKIFPTHPPPVSKETYVIGGILTTVFGLAELLQDSKNVACLWLLHPRLQSQKCMEPIAASIINDWNSQLKLKAAKGRVAPGLIAVSFDQRNHGSRQIESVANEAWISGNETHAQDMFSSYRQLSPFNLEICTSDASRWHFTRHLTAHHLSSLLHLSQLGALPHRPSGSRCLPWWTCSLALHPT